VVEEEHRPQASPEAGASERDTARFVALFLLGLVLFNPLFLVVFDAPGAAAFGIPLLYVYLFASWAILIALAAWLSRHIGASTPPPLRPQPGPPGGD
jgi:hypothetical protein